MKANQAPIWSFLAVEPTVRAARRRMPEAFAIVASPVASAAARRAAFERITNWVGAALKDTPAALRHSPRMLAVQVFYAIVDLSDQRALPDRDLQRWMNQLMGGTRIDIPTHAVVEPRLAAAV